MRMIAAMLGIALLASPIFAQDTERPVTPDWQFVDNMARRIGAELNTHDTAYGDTTIFAFIDLPEGTMEAISNLSLFGISQNDIGYMIQESYLNAVCGTLWDQERLDGFFLLGGEVVVFALESVSNDAAPPKFINGSDCMNYWRSVR